MFSRRLIALIARRGSGRLLDTAVNRLFPDSPAKVLSSTPAARSTLPAKSSRPPKSSLGGKVATVALASLARRSVPAAIIIGGGMLAKRLYDARRARKMGSSDDQS